MVSGPPVFSLSPSLNLSFHYFHFCPALFSCLFLREKSRTEWNFNTTATFIVVLGEPCDRKNKDVFSGNSCMSFSFEGVKWVCFLMALILFSPSEFKNLSLSDPLFLFTSERNRRLCCERSWQQIFSWNHSNLSKQPQKFSFSLLFLASAPHYCRQESELAIGIFYVWMYLMKRLSQFTKSIACSQIHKVISFWGRTSLLKVKVKSKKYIYIYIFSHIRGLQYVSLSDSIRPPSDSIITFSIRGIKKLFLLDQVWNQKP